MDIQTSTETVTVTKYTLTLTDADVAAILVDAGPLQKQLREMRGETKRGRHGAKDIKLGRPTKEKPAKAAGKALRCPDCPRTFETAARLAIHRGRSHKSAASAAPSPASG